MDSCCTTSSSNNGSEDGGCVPLERNGDDVEESERKGQGEDAGGMSHGGED